MDYRARREFLLGLGALGVAACSGGMRCDCTCGAGAAQSVPHKTENPRQPPVIVYVVRHAEKADGEDPPLSEEGAMRAMSLHKAVPVAQLDAIYSTDTKRTRQTVDPVAAVTGLPVEIYEYDAKKLRGLRDQIRKHAGGKVLVASHSDLIPRLLRSLGVSDKVEVADEQYGDVWIVTAKWDGSARMRRARYGKRKRRQGPERAAPARTP